MDQYFNQMDKIIKERKTSSRIRFMLQDVLDLRMVKQNYILYLQIQDFKQPAVTCTYVLSVAQNVSLLIGKCVF